VKILIAEDDPSLLENLQWMLELEGYEVRAAPNGLRALALALQDKPDLVLTDVTMPELDGYGLVRALRDHATLSGVPIIMLTAKADRSDVRQAMNLGADDYLTKPCKRKELLQAIQARLTRNAALEQTAKRLQVQAQEAQLRDALTALPSRALFGQRLQAQLASGQHQATGVVCLGLDGFSKVNDSLGTGVGDKLLCEVAQRLLQHTRAAAPATPAEPGAGVHRDGESAQDTAPRPTEQSAHDATHAASPERVARLGSDHFAVHIADAGDAHALQEHALALLALLAQPYHVDGHTLFLTSCAGYSLYPEQADAAQALLRNAESALHHAKADGPGSALMFDATMNQRVARRLQIHNDLHRALALGELQVYYQPQVRIDSGALVGFEALLRWHHSTLGWISPAEFIPIAEESGTIVALGAWVMRVAAQQAADWLAQGHAPFRMAVNLSVRQFTSGDLLALLRDVLAATGLPAHMLELEITESLALQNVASTLSTLRACKDLGVQLAMDDFGTGYSSLAYLKRYPLDALKIDQAFVRNLARDPGDAAITRAIVAMAHSFGMSVIAEGVETRAQLEFLRDLRCEDFQGYLFSKPVPADQAERYFSGYHPPAHAR